MPALTARYERQFALHLPQSGPDTGLGAIIPPGKAKGTALATHLVHEGEEMVVAGLRMKFYTRYFSDSEDSLTIHVPELDLVYNNFLWPSLFNFYTLRGINKGLSPDQLKEFVQMPQVLRDFPNNAETYSEFFYFPLHMYHHIFGWFDGDAASIHRLPAAEEAARIIEGFGGADKVLAQYLDNMANGDLVWASRLAGWLLATEPENITYRKSQAETLRQIAYRSPGTIARHFCLTQALEMENAIQPVRSVLPSIQAILAVEPGRYINFFRIRLDPKKSGDTRQRLTIHITDKNSHHTLELRHGVCEYLESADTSAPQLSLSHQDWARFYVGETSLQELLASGAAKANQPQEVQQFIACFDSAEAACAP